MELRNGVHKYQPIVLAAGSIALEHRKSMIMPCYLRYPSGVFTPQECQKCQVQPDSGYADLGTEDCRLLYAERTCLFAKAEKWVVDRIPHCVTDGRDEDRA